MDVMLRLDASRLAEMRAQFIKNGDELPLHKFVSLMLAYFPTTVDKLATVRDLCELFAQVDVDGNALMEWDEFTGYCIEAGVASGQFKPRAQWGVREHAGFAGNTPHNLKVTRLVYLQPLGKMFALEEETHTFRIYDMHGVDNMNAGIPLLCSICLDDTTDDDGGDPTDVLYLEEWKLLAVSALNFSVYFFDATPLVPRVRHDSDSEESDTDKEGKAGSGDEDEDGEGGRKPKFFLRCHTPTPQRRISWMPDCKRLFGISNNALINVWDVRCHYDDQRRRRLFMSHVSRLEGHTEPARDLIGVPSLGFVVSVAMDRTMRVWDSMRLRLLATKTEHQQGVRCVTYCESAEILVTAGFDTYAQCWSLKISYGAPAFKLRGHTKSIVSVTSLVTRPECVTVDETGVFKVWNLLTHASILEAERCLQTFTTLDSMASGIPYPARHMAGIPTPDADPEAFIVAGPRLKAFQYERIEAEAAPASVILFNTEFITFVVASHKDVLLLDGATGAVTSTFSDVVDDEITAMAFDGRERKVVIATSAGQIPVLNYLNGAVMKTLTPHDGEVTDLLYIHEDLVVISVGWDRAIRVHDEGSMEGTLLREVTHAHDADIVVVAGSRDLGLFATGARNGSVRMWDFQMASFEKELIGHEAAVSAMVFLDPLPLLVTADIAGWVMVWILPPGLPRYRCLARFLNLNVGSGPGAYLRPGLSKAQHALAAPPRSRPPSSRASKGRSPSGSPRRRARLGASNQRVLSADAPKLSTADGVAHMAAMIDPTFKLGPDLRSPKLPGTVILVTASDNGEIGMWDLTPVIFDAGICIPKPGELAPNKGNYNPYRKIRRDGRTSREEAASDDEGGTGGGAASGGGGGVPSARKSPSCTPSASSNASARRSRKHSVSSVIPGFPKQRRGGTNLHLMSAAGLESVPQLRWWQAHNEPVARVQVLTNPPFLVSHSTSGVMCTWNVLPHAVLHLDPHRVPSPSRRVSTATGTLSRPGTPAGSTRKMSSFVPHELTVEVDPLDDNLVFPAKGLPLPGFKSPRRPPPRSPRTPRAGLHPRQWCLWFPGRSAQPTGAHWEFPVTPLVEAREKRQVELARSVLADVEAAVRSSDSEEEPVEVDAYEYDTIKAKRREKLQQAMVVASQNVDPAQAEFVGQERGRLFGQLFGEATWVRTAGEDAREQAAADIEQQLKKREKQTMDYMVKKYGWKRPRRRRRRKGTGTAGQAAGPVDTTWTTLKELEQLKKDEDLQRIAADTSGPPQLLRADDPFNDQGISSLQKQKTLYPAMYCEVDRGMAPKPDAAMRRRVESAGVTMESAGTPAPDGDVPVVSQSPPPSAESPPPPPPSPLRPVSSPIGGAGAGAGAGASRSRPPSRSPSRSPSRGRMSPITSLPRLLSPPAQPSSADLAAAEHALTGSHRLAATAPAGRTPVSPTKLPGYSSPAPGRQSTGGMGDAVARLRRHVHAVTAAIRMRKAAAKLPSWEKTSDTDINHHRLMRQEAELSTLICTMERTERQEKRKDRRVKKAIRRRRRTNAKKHSQSLPSLHHRTVSRLPPAAGALQDESVDSTDAWLAEATAMLKLGGLAAAPARELEAALSPRSRLLVLEDRWQRRLKETLVSSDDEDRPKPMKKVSSLVALRTAGSSKAREMRSASLLADIGRKKATKEVKRQATIRRQLSFKGSHEPIEMPTDEKPAGLADTVPPTPEPEPDLPKTAAELAADRITKLRNEHAAARRRSIAAFGMYSRAEVMDAAEALCGLPLDSDETFDMEAFVTSTPFQHTALLKFNLESLFHAVGKGTSKVALTTLLKVLFPHADRGVLRQIVDAVRKYIRKYKPKNEPAPEETELAPPPPPLSQKAINQMRALFKLYDTDGSGTVSLEELANAFSVGSSLYGKRGAMRMHGRMSTDDLKGVIHSVNRDDDKELNFDEFVVLMEGTFSPRRKAQRSPLPEP